MSDAVTMRDRFARVVTRLLADDPRLAVVLADIGTRDLARALRRYPERVINVGIREQLMVSVAGGMALAGFRVIAHSYAPFLVERPFEQVKLDLGHQGVGAVLVSVGASYDWTEGGRTHQAPEDVAIVSALPGWSVEVPGHPDEAEALLRDGVLRDDCIYLRLSARANLTPMPIVPGRFHVVRRGSEGVVIAVGPMLDPTVDAVADLDVTVLYATTVRPWDAATLRSELREPAVVLVEPYLEGTSSAQVSAALTGVPHRLLALGVPLVERRRYGSPLDHDRAQGLDVPSLRKRISEFLIAPPMAAGRGAALAVGAWPVDVSADAARPG